MENPAFPLVPEWNLKPVCRSICLARSLHAILPARTKRYVQSHSLSFKWKDQSVVDRVGEQKEAFSVSVYGLF